MCLIEEAKLSRVELVSTWMGESAERPSQCVMPPGGYLTMNWNLPDFSFLSCLPWGLATSTRKEGVLCQQIPESGLLGDFRRPCCVGRYVLAGKEVRDSS